MVLNIPKTQKGPNWTLRNVYECASMSEEHTGLANKILQSTKMSVCN